jgi:hypothetical protein
MTFATNERVDKALRLLTYGLAPYVEAKMKARHGNGWRVQASRAGGADPRAALDAWPLKDDAGQLADGFRHRPQPRGAQLREPGSRRA